MFMEKTRLLFRSFEKNKMNYLILILLYFSVGIVFAQPNGQIPIEKIEEKILLDKTKKNQMIANVAKWLNQRNFEVALKVAQGLSQKTDFLDYFHYISGKCLMEMMIEEVKKKNWNKAAQYGEQAAAHMKAVPGSFAYTPLTKRSVMMLARIEMEFGWIQKQLKKKALARVMMESGFQRYLDSGLLVLVPRFMMQDYAALCDQKPDELCISWEVKLGGVLTKPDRNSIFPKLDEVKFPYVDKSTSIPYKVDMDLQLFQQGFDSYLQGKYAEAFKSLDELINTYPRTNIKLRTKYWIARAAQKLGEKAKAETLYKEIIREIPFSYYALLSMWNSGIDVLRNIDAVLPMATTSAQLSTPADHVRLKRAEIFIANRAFEFARYELKEIKPKENMSNEFLVYLTGLNHISRNYVVSFQFMNDLSYRNYTGFQSSYGEKMIFPSLEIKNLETFARANSLDPVIIMSLMKQESAFNSEAISTSNAFGLMQIITPTARDLDSEIEAENLFDPDRNMSLGARYVKQLMKRFDGEIIYALAGYNAGPGNADKWRALAKEKDNLAPDEAIELIGFKETHDYVQNILRNYYWYKRRFNGEGAASLEKMLAEIKAEGN